MDYDDILLEVLHLFERGETEAAAEKHRANSFSYLLVDEFQDINEIQYRLIKEWGRESKSIFIIGDPDQAIYGFRGSDFRYFDRFKEDFPAARYIRLTDNYRSTPQIISSAAAVISGKVAGRAAARPLKAKRKSGVKVRLLETGSDFSEAVFVAKEINRLVGGIDMLEAHTTSADNRKKPVAKQSRGFSDIAVLYRTNRQAEILEQCFRKEGIQYMVVGREEFLAEKPVREALAFFRFLLNPADTASLSACLKAEGISLADLNGNVFQKYAESEKSLSSLARIIEGLKVSPNHQDRLRQFINRLQKYDTIIRKEKPGKIIDCWIKEKNLADLKCMELLLNTAVMYDGMSCFLQNLVLGRESDIVRSGGKVYTADAVQLMTIHAAKGLEFPIVFICGVNDGMIPLRDSNSGSDLDEERRLFYVGMTRARDELILLTSRTPSPFIDDISPEHLMRESAFTRKQANRYKQASLFD